MNPDEGGWTGPYRLIEPIGEGGMGTVWRAEQSEPVRREVAVKVVRPGLASAESLARFEAERQALALMDHPHIAKALDAGTIRDPSGLARPCFVMELVKGVPLTRYLDERRLTLRRRLELFVSVCRAVQHAHQKGVIHRDLKPGNVLVSDSEGGPVPKVIDFGIAKALGARLTDRTAVTGPGRVVGTLEYMSPEQARDAVDVDTRSDVYSLGVMLCEVLTGVRPRPAGQADRLRPSELVASSPLRRRVRGDLDRIVMKCLEEDRSRRYESASALAADLQRHLLHEPIEAQPPGLGYRLRKWIQRRPVGAIGVATCVFLAIGGGGLLLWLDREASARAAERALRLGRLESEISAALTEATAIGEQAEGRVDDLARWQAGSSAALSALRRAEALAGQAGGDVGAVLLGRLRETRTRLEADARDLALLTRVEQFQVEVSRGDPVINRWVWVVPRASVEEAFREWGIEYGRTPPQEVSARLSERPARVRDSVQTALFSSFTLLEASESEGVRGWIDRLIQDVERDPWRRAVLRALRKRDTAALEKLVEDLDTPAQPAAFLVLVAGADPGQTASQAYRMAVLRKGQEAYPSNFWLNEKLAFACHWADPPQIEEAIRFYTAALALQPRNAAVWHNLGEAFCNREPRDFRNAAAAFERAIAIEPAYRASRGRFALMLEAIGEDWPRTIEAYRAWVAVAPDDPRAMKCLGVVLRNHGDRREALDWIRRAVEHAPRNAEYRVQLASLLAESGNPSAAEAECRAAIAIDPQRPDAHENLGYALEDQGHLPGAEAALRQALSLDLVKADRARISGNLGLVLRTRGNFAGAIESLRRAVELDPNVPEAHFNLGLALDGVFDQDAAIDSYRQALALRPTYTNASEELARALFNRGDIAASLEVLEEADRLLQPGSSRRAALATSIEERKRFLSLDRRLSDVLAGRDAPSGPEEEWEFAALAARRGLWRPAARWALHALTVRPGLAHENGSVRVDAAVFAAQAALMPGPDASDAERAEWRDRALAWLLAELRSLRKKATAGGPTERAAVLRILRSWQGDPEFAGLRDPAALADLAEPERERCRLLWAKVDEVLQVAGRPP